MEKRVDVCPVCGHKHFCSHSKKRPYDRQCTKCHHISFTLRKRISYYMPNYIKLLPKVADKSELDF